MFRKKLKGFTLVELITVLAIVAVLTGVLVPSMSYFIRNAKLKSSNSQAKVVFNAALTVSQEYEAKNLCMTSPSDGSFPGSAQQDYSNINPVATDELADAFIKRVNAKVMGTDSDDDVWAVRFEKTGEFPVLVSACYATTSEDRYVGGYPVNTESTGGNYRSLTSDISGWLTEASGS